MLTTSTGQTPEIAAPTAAKAANANAPTLTMVSAGRMAGEIAVWSSPEKTQNTVARLQDDAAKSADENRPATATPVTTAAATHPFTFHDLLDMINPLQHIPGVNQVYRRLTGDTINPAMQVAGDALYGGPLGGVISLANMLITQATGHDIPGEALAMVRGQDLVTPAVAAEQEAAVMPAAGKTTIVPGVVHPHASAFQSLHLNS